MYGFSMFIIFCTTYSVYLSAWTHQNMCFQNNRAIYDLVRRFSCIADLTSNRSSNQKRHLWDVLTDSEHSNVYSLPLQNYRYSSRYAKICDRFVYGVHRGFGRFIIWNHSAKSNMAVVS